MFAISYSYPGASCENFFYFAISIIKIILLLAFKLSVVTPVILGLMPVNCIELVNTSLISRIAFALKDIFPSSIH